MAATPHTLIIGAGIGGLTTAALLLQAGQRVTVLEAHIYPGGSAGTFYNRGYRFDAGATLAGGFAPGGPHARLAQQLGLQWPVRAEDPAWVVHLPGQHITQWSDPRRWQAERQRAFPGTEAFWQRQEMLADLAWDLSSRSFPWPPTHPKDALALLRGLRPRTLQAAPYIFRAVRDLVPPHPPEGFLPFLDAQLLISAQTTAQYASAIYGSAALDLPRRGVNTVRTGIGALAQTLVQWIRAHGGEVHYRQTVDHIVVREGHAVGVRTAKGLDLSADSVVANVTPWALAELLGEQAPARLRREVTRRAPTWGAFILYVGVSRKAIPAGSADHHQVIVDPGLPLGEGNSVFLSLSDASDPTRAPAGMRAITLSTHTRVAPWWGSDSSADAARRERYTEMVLAAAEMALPGLRSGVQVCLPGTPRTFQHYLRRPQGMVGGFAQNSLFAARGPSTGVKNLWLVGDSVFPGQSTAGVTLGGWRVADAILHKRSG